MRKELSYLKLVVILSSKWPLLLLSAILGTLFAYGYLCFSSPVYISRTSLKFEDRRSELSELTSIRNLYDRTNKTESEKLIIRSDQVIRNAFKSLNYPVSFYVRENFKLVNCYPEKLLDVRILQKNTPLGSTTCTFKEVNKQRYQLSLEDREGRITVSEYNYGTTISLPEATFRILKLNSETNKPVIFRFNHEGDYLEKINRSLKIDDHLNVNVLKLSMCDSNPYFATDILNAIVDQYLNFDRSLRSSSAVQTEKFITDILERLDTNTRISKLQIQKFKVAYPFLKREDLIAKLEMLKEEQRQLKLKEIQINFIKTKLPILTESLNQDLSGMTDPQLLSLIGKFNELFIRKQEKLSQFTPTNPSVIELDKQITNLKKSIENNLKNQLANLSIQNDYLDTEMQHLITIVKKSPHSEGTYMDLESKLAVQEKVNTYLSEKKLEAQISKSAVTAGASIIDRAMPASNPLSPVPKNVYINFILSCLLLTSIAILVIRMANIYIYNQDEITAGTSIPLIGVVRYHKSLPDQPFLLLDEPRSPFSESIRGLRSNLAFLQTHHRCKIIHTSSEIAGEGKSLITLNLGIAISLTKKRVLLIAADLRKPSLHHRLKISNQHGLSNYLAGNAPLEKILTTTSISNLDFIPAGTLAPNPSELLLSARMTDLLEQLRLEYDYILLDSAPVGLVSDGKPLIKSADINLFVLRSGLSRHHFIDTAERLKNEFQLNNLVLILNGVKESPFHDSYYKGTGSNRQTAYQYPTQHPHQYNDYFEI